MRWIDFEGRKPTDALPGWVAWEEHAWQKWLTKSGRLLEQMRVLNDEAEQLKSTDEVAAATKIDARNKIITDNGSHWGKLKPWLLALSHGKCWFSETKDNFSHYEIEHFRPKKEAKDDENPDENGKAVIRDGYWWLAFDYTNFRICGNVGNRKKGGWFPLKAGSPCSRFSSQCEESEIPYLLDPTDPSDIDLIAFDDEGKVIARPGSSEWERARVDISVKRLKLEEHEVLTEARRDIWQKVSREIEGFLTAKQRSASGNNPAAKEKLRNHIRNIRAMLRPEAPLSSVAQWCVSFRNEPHLLKLLT